MSPCWFGKLPATLHINKMPTLLYLRKSLSPINALPSTFTKTERLMCMENRFPKGAVSILRNQRLWKHNTEL